MTPAPPRALTEADRKLIADAASYLENPSFLIRATGALGAPIERGLRLLPETARREISRATQLSLEKALRVTLPTLRRDRRSPAWERWANGAGSALSGGFCGFFGMVALPLELPVTTALLLRAIAQVAADYGEDLDDESVRLECLSVLSHGTRRSTQEGSAVESAYFELRIGTAGLLRESARFMASKTAAEVAEGIAKGTAPTLVRLIARVAAQFEAVVAQKIAAQAVPVIGAATGATLNVLFLEHFTTVARHHFGIRRLERDCGGAAVREAYERAASARRP